jgi:hypothetical protein
MLSDADCSSHAEHCLAQIAQQCGEDLVLLPTSFGTSTTLAYGNKTADYVATGDSTHALAGNGQSSRRNRTPRRGLYSRV